MIAAVVGSRGFNNYDLLSEELSKYNICEIVSGGAAGTDKLAERYAAEWEKPIKVFKPDWSTGRGAGLARNTDIINVAEIIIAFWDGESTGTFDSINKAKKANKHLIVIRY